MTSEQTKLLFERCCDKIAMEWALTDMKSFIAQGRPYFGNQDAFFAQVSELFAKEFAREKVKDSIKLARIDEELVGHDIVQVKYTEQEILEKLKL